MTQKLTLKSTVNVEALAEATAIAKRGLAERTTLPVTNCFLVNFNGNTEVIATDLEVMVKVTVKQSSVLVDGRVIIPGKLFNDVLDELNLKPKLQVKRNGKRQRKPAVKRLEFVRYDNQDTFMTCDNFGFRFTTRFEAEDFPPMNDVQGDTLNILDVPGMLKNLLKHCPNENKEYRTSLYGVEFDLDKDKVIACDSFTMGIAKLLHDGSTKGTFRIPRKAAEILSKLDGTCEVTFSKERVKLVIGNVELITMNLDGQAQYPDFEKLDTEEKPEIKAKIKHYS